MHKNTLQHCFQAGFTLLEIMLVLVLIGMASVGVVMTMPQHLNENEDVDWQAQRFSTQLQFAEDEALISGKELAIVFDEDSYRYAFYDHATKKWLALQSDQIGKLVTIPEALTFEYELLGSVWDEIESQEDDSFIKKEDLVQIDGEDKIESFSPQVFVMSSGQVTPFNVTFSENDKGVNPRISSLAVNMSGSITLTKSSDQ